MCGAAHIALEFNALQAVTRVASHLGIPLAAPQPTPSTPGVPSQLGSEEAARLDDIPTQVQTDDNHRAEAHTQLSPDVGEMEAAAPPVPYHDPVEVMGASADDIQFDDVATQVALQRNATVGAQASPTTPASHAASPEHEAAPPSHESCPETHTSASDEATLAASTPVASPDDEGTEQQEERQQDAALPCVSRPSSDASEVQAGAPAPTRTVLRRVDTRASEKIARRLDPRAQQPRTSVPSSDSVLATAIAPSIAGSTFAHSAATHSGPW